MHVKAIKKQYPIKQPFNPQTITLQDLKNFQKEQTEKTENAQKEWKSAIQVSSGLHKRK